MGESKERNAEILSDFKFLPFRAWTFSVHKFLLSSFSGGEIFGGLVTSIEDFQKTGSS